jgi:hypothetical protein
MKPTYPCKLYYIFTRASEGVPATLSVPVWLTDKQVADMKEPTEKIGSPHTFFVCADELKKCFATAEDIS